MIAGSPGWRGDGSEIRGRAGQGRGSQASPNFGKPRLLSVPSERGHTNRMGTSISTPNPRDQAPRKVRVNPQSPTMALKNRGLK